MGADGFEVGDRPGDGVWPAPFGPPAATLIPADHPDVFGQRRGEGSEHIPQARAAVAQDQRIPVPAFGYPEPTAVVGEDGGSSSR